jgi:hypothetical protein
LGRAGSGNQRRTGAHEISELALGRKKARGFTSISAFATSSMPPTKKSLERTTCESWAARTPEVSEPNRRLVRPGVQFVIVRLKLLGDSAELAANASQLIEIRSRPVE